MITLEDFPKHIQSLKKEDWAKLFNLLDEINPNTHFGHINNTVALPDGATQFPYFNFDPVVHCFLKVVNELNIMINFDWSAWKEGKATLENRETNYDKLDIVTLCKLLTIIVRSDRFVDGTLVGSFEDGIIQKIIRGLRKEITR